MSGELIRINLWVIFLAASATVGWINEKIESLWRFFESNLNLLSPVEANHHWLNSDYPVTIMSTAYISCLCHVACSISIFFNMLATLCHFS